MWGPTGWRLRNKRETGLGRKGRVGVTNEGDPGMRLKWKRGVTGGREGRDGPKKRKYEQ